MSCSPVIQGVGTGKLSADLAEVIEIERSRRTLDARAAVLLARIDREGSADVESGMTTGLWLAYDAVIPKSQAKRRTSVAKRLAQFPLFAASLAKGRISWSHCEVLTNTCTEHTVKHLYEVEAEYVAYAEILSFETFEQVMAALKRRAAANDAPDGTPPPEQKDTAYFSQVGDLFKLDAWPWVGVKSIGPFAASPRSLRPGGSLSTDAAPTRCPRPLS